MLFTPGLGDSNTSRQPKHIIVHTCSDFVAAHVSSHRRSNVGAFPGQSNWLLLKQPPHPALMMYFSVSCCCGCIRAHQCLEYKNGKCLSYRITLVCRCSFTLSTCKPNHLRRISSMFHSIFNKCIQIL